MLGPKNYIMYTTPVGSICRIHGLNHHFYADNSQLYLFFKPVDKVSRDKAGGRVESCLEDVMSWMHCNMLKLNADKTELIVFTQKKNSSQIIDLSMTIGRSEVKQSTCVRNLGAFLDSRMDMEHHVNTVCKSCYSQLRQIGRIRQYLTIDATKSVINSLVTSRLDYCNSLLNGLPKTVLNKLQIVQNTAARIITRTSRSSHITLVLKELHWLPVQYRIHFKILTHTYKALHGQSPEYVSSILEVY